jgi:chloramphenicol O-acetyltransferase
MAIAIEIELRTVLGIFNRKSKVNTKSIITRIYYEQDGIKFVLKFIYAIVKAARNRESLQC